VPEFAIVIILATEDDTPQNLSNEILHSIERDPKTSVKSIVVLDPDGNELSVYDKEKK
jgi:hypothetical protein